MRGSQRELINQVIDTIIGLVGELGDYKIIPRRPTRHPHASRGKVKVCGDYARLVVELEYGQPMFPIHCRACYVDCDLMVHKFKGYGSEVVGRGQHRYHSIDRAKSEAQELKCFINRSMERFKLVDIPYEPMCNQFAPPYRYDDDGRIYSINTARSARVLGPVGIRDNRVVGAELIGDSYQCTTLPPDVDDPLWLVALKSKHIITDGDSYYVLDARGELYDYPPKDPLSVVDQGLIVEAIKFYVANNF